MELRAPCKKALCKKKGSGALVGLIEEFEDRHAGGALAEEPAEHVLLQIAEDDIHGLKVLLGLIFGGQEQNDGEDRLMVESGEVDSGDAAADGSGHAFDHGVLDVRDGDSLAEAGGTVLFALDEGGDDFIHGGGGERLGGGKGGGEFSECAVAIGGLEIGDDRIGNDEFLQLS